MIMKYFSRALWSWAALFWLRRAKAKICKNIPKIKKVMPKVILCISCSIMYMKLNNFYRPRSTFKTTNCSFKM